MRIRHSGQEPALAPPLEIKLEQRHASEKFDCDPLTSKVLKHGPPRAHAPLRKSATQDDRSSFLKRMERFRQNQTRRPSIKPSLELLPRFTANHKPPTAKPPKPAATLEIEKLETLQTEMVVAPKSAKPQHKEPRRKSEFTTGRLHRKEKLMIEPVSENRRKTDFAAQKRQSRFLPQMFGLMRPKNDSEAPPPEPPEDPSPNLLKPEVEEESLERVPRATLVQEFRKSHDYKTGEIINPNAKRLRNLKNYPRCMVFPDDPWKKRWDTVMLLACVATSLLTPYHVAFYDMSSVEWLVGESVIDFIFFVDIVLSFITVYYTSTEEVIDDRKLIICSYLRSWFVVDVISILPIHHILEAQTSKNSLGQLARIPRIYRITKTLKIMRMMKFVQKGSLLKQSMNHLSVAFDKSLKLATGFLLLLHTMSCFWFLAAKLDDFPDDCWVIRYGLEGANPLHQYLDSLYFIVTTITTVGYGDRTVGTPVEIIFCCILMIIGVIAYTMVISQLTIIISAHDKKQAALKEKLDILQNIRK